MKKKTRQQGAVNDKRTLDDHLNDPPTPEEEFHKLAETLAEFAREVKQVFPGKSEGDLEVKKELEIIARGAESLKPGGEKKVPETWKRGGSSEKR